MWAVAEQGFRAEGVFLFVVLGCLIIAGVLFQVILRAVKRREAPELADTHISGHGGDFACGEKLPAQTLHILPVAFGLSPGAAFCLHGDGGLAQPIFRNFLDCGAFQTFAKDDVI